MKISYCTSVHNEHQELNRLLTQLIEGIDDEDEIIIQGDQGKVTDEVVSVLHKFKRDPRVQYIEYPLNKDFATFKNNLLKHCKGDYFVNIDADETIAPFLLKNIKNLLEENPDIDLFRVPRINIVEGLTRDYLFEQKWTLNNQGWINFPDFQSRIGKRKESIFWINPVHEVLHGAQTRADLPMEPDYCLIHEKTISRQIEQNNFYKTWVV